MLNKEIIINGFNLRNKGLYISSIVNPLPETEIEYAEILGQYGSIPVETNYKNREINIECFLSSSNITVDKKMREIINIFDPMNDILITFNTDKNVFYIGRINMVKDIAKETLNSINFTIELFAQPEIYIVKDEISVNTVEELKNLNELDYVKGILPVINW